jgi:hypothetical protein
MLVGGRMDVGLRLDGHQMNGCQLQWLVTMTPYNAITDDVTTDNVIADDYGN